MDRKRRKKHKIPHSSDASHDKDRRRAYSEGNYVKSLVVVFEKLNDAEMDSDSSVFSDSEDSQLVSCGEEKDSRSSERARFTRRDSYRSAINDDGWQESGYVAETICKYESRPGSLVKSCSFNERDGRGNMPIKFFTKSKIPVAKKATFQLYLPGKNDGDSFYESFLDKKLSPLSDYSKKVKEKTWSENSEVEEEPGGLKKVEDVEDLEKSMSDQQSSPWTSKKGWVGTVRKTIEEIELAGNSKTEKPPGRPKMSPVDIKKAIFAKEIDKQAEGKEEPKVLKKESNREILESQLAEGLKVVVTEKEIQKPQKLSQELVQELMEKQSGDDCQDDCPPGKFGATLKGPGLGKPKTGLIHNSLQKNKDQLEKTPRGDFLEEKDESNPSDTTKKQRMYKRRTGAYTKPQLIKNLEEKYSTRNDSGYYSEINFLNWESWDESPKKTQLHRIPTRKLNPELKDKFKSEEYLQAINKTLKKAMSASNLGQDCCDNRIYYEPSRYDQESLVEATNCKLVTEMRRLSDADETILRKTKEDPTKNYYRISRVLLDQDNNPVMKTETIGVKDENETIVEEVYPCRNFVETPEEVVEQGKTTKKMQSIIQELLHTEETYIRSMKIVIDEYMPEMDRIDLPPCLEGKFEQIFGNIGAIYEEHRKTLFPKLKDCKNLEEIAEIFLSHDNIFSLYTEYNRNKTNSERILGESGMFFQKKQRELNDPLDLSSYLLVPTQRLFRYVLLLQTLVRECNKEDHPCSSLSQACTYLESEIRKENDLVAIDQITESKVDLNSQGTILLRNEFSVWTTNRKNPFPAMAFLFEKCLLITAIIDGAFVFRDCVTFEDLGFTQVDYDPLEFKIWFRKHDQKVYNLKTKKEDVKNLWADTIKAELWKQLEETKRMHQINLEKRKKSIAVEQPKKESKSDSGKIDIQHGEEEVRRSFVEVVDFAEKA